MRINITPPQATLLRALAAEYLQGYVLLAYGSRVHGGGHAGSDLDLVVLHPAMPDAPCPAVEDFREALRESDLPFLTDVHDWARIPAAFRSQIVAGCVQVFPPPA